MLSKNIAFCKTLYVTLQVQHNIQRFIYIANTVNKVVIVTGK